MHNKLKLVLPVKETFIESRKLQTEFYTYFKIVIKIRMLKE